MKKEKKDRLFGDYFLKINVGKKNLCSSKESPLKDLHELAAYLFTKGKTASEETQNANAEAENKKKQPNKEFQSNANLSSLARFLLSRLVKNSFLHLILCLWRILW